MECFSMDPISGFDLGKFRVSGRVSRPKIDLRVGSGFGSDLHRVSGRVGSIFRAIGSGRVRNSDPMFNSAQR